MADGVVVLFYAYTPLSDPEGVVGRIQAVCENAGVTGKLRIAAEVSERERRREAPHEKKKEE